MKRDNKVHTTPARYYGKTIGSLRYTTTSEVRGSTFNTNYYLPSDNTKKKKKDLQNNRDVIEAKRFLRRLQKNKSTFTG